MRSARRSKVHPTRCGRQRVPRLLINRERVGEGDLFMNPRGFDWASATDGFYGGDCDAAVGELCGMLGWEEELKRVLEASKV